MSFHYFKMEYMLNEQNGRNTRSSYKKMLLMGEVAVNTKEIRAVDVNKNNKRGVAICNILYYSIV